MKIGRAVRVTEPVRIDGRLDEAVYPARRLQAWQEISWIATGSASASRAAQRMADRRGERGQRSSWARTCRP